MPQWWRMSLMGVCCRSWCATDSLCRACASNGTMLPHTHRLNSEKLNVCCWSITRFHLNTSRTNTGCRSPVPVKQRHSRTVFRLSPAPYAGLRGSYRAFNRALGDLYSDDLLRLAEGDTRPDFDDTAFFDAAGMVYKAGQFDASMLNTPEARK